MRNMLALLATAAITFIGLGWYLDWYSVQTGVAPSGHRSVSIDLNSPKIASDVSKGLQKGEKKLQSVLQNRTSASSPPSNIGPQMP